MVLTKKEKRALLLAAMVIFASSVIQWLRPYQVHTSPYDYTLQDSLFKILSADTLPEKNKSLKEASSKPVSRKRKRTKKKKQQLKPKSININTADAALLEKLPYIGPKTARAIVEYRKEHGPFKTIEELDNVKRIGPKTIERIRPFIFIGDSTGKSVN